MSKSKTLINSVETAVTDAIDGYLLTRPDLVRLDGYPGTKVIARRSIDKAKVAVISGGGAGHEPAHGGLVGSGLLTSAVSGDVFASPHVKAIIAAIRHSSTTGAGAGGCLLVVKNYTGDRLAFGLAAETARSEGYKVEVVFVAEDVAVDGGPITGRRGLAGTVLVHKVAGALAEEGKSLEVVAAAARAVARNVHTIGASLSVCSVPGAVVSTRLSGEDVMEVGLGIHGEPGAKQAPLGTADELAKTFVDMIAKHVTEGNGEAAIGRSSVFLLNNLGGLSNLEMSIFTRSIINAAAEGKSVMQPSHLLVAPLMTSLDMKGVSFTVLLLDTAEKEFASATGSSTSTTIISALRAPVNCPHWPPLIDLAGVSASSSIVPMPAAPSSSSSLSSASASSSNGPAVPLSIALKCVQAVAAAIATQEAELGRLDTIAGDGDAGLTMRRIAGAAVDAVESFAGGGAAAGDGDGAGTSSVPLADILGRIADGIAEEAGGSSGVLYALMFRAAQHAAATSSSSSSDLRAALAQVVEAGVAAVSHYGGARAGHRTMLDALIPASEALAGGKTAAEVAAAADAGATASAGMLPAAGRASYVSKEVCLGSRDAGAHAVAVWVGAVAGTLCG